ncbi:MAG: right-handed parallel beta-helix repeat-containing protein [Phycisphaerales bacterium]|nr:right-handed parallel beta-helix repeat-containing protein [Phycisphaerales bacterium]
MSIRTTCSIGALALGAVFSFTSIAIAQTTYYVNGSCGDDSWTGLSPVCEAPNGPKATIQAGINAADHFDSVEVADGIYTGPGNKNIEFFQKEMSIRSSGGPEQCIIDCENDGLGFTFCTLPDDRPVTIEGFTIRNGRHEWAGGICISSAEVTIDNCIVEQCVSDGRNGNSTGGILIADSPVRILRTIIRSNRVSGNPGYSDGFNGGGISIAGSPWEEVLIEDSVIEGNEVESTNRFLSARGGGIAVREAGSLHMRRCTVAGNRVVGYSELYRPSGGGGIYIDGRFGATLIEDSTIRDNVVVALEGEVLSRGGGAWLFGDVSVQGCTIIENEASLGGGLYLGSDYSRTLSLDDVEVARNNARADGGGIYYSSSNSSNATLQRVRLVNNHAERDGGGAYATAGQWDWCTIQGNTAARHGGGAYVAPEAFLTYPWHFAQSTMSGNRAGADGGALYSNSDLSLSECLIFGNSSIGRGGGAFVKELDGLYHTKRSTIVDNAAGSGAGGIHIESADEIRENPFSMVIWRNSPTSVVDQSGLLQFARSNIEGGWFGVGNIDADPRFVDPGAGDYRLSGGSPCIDAGDNRSIYTEVDLSGQPRRVNDAGMPDAGYGLGALADMGCYEFQGTSSGFIAVHPRPGVAGRENQLQAAGATPGNVVYFVYGFAAGSTGVPGCPGVNVEIANPRIAAQAAADGSGYASAIISISSAAAGRGIVLQAVDQDACGVSNVVGYRFP